MNIPIKYLPPEGALAVLMNVLRREEKYSQVAAAREPEIEFQTELPHVNQASEPPIDPEFLRLDSGLCEAMRRIETDIYINEPRSAQIDILDKFDGWRRRNIFANAEQLEFSFPMPHQDIIPHFDAEFPRVTCIAASTLRYIRIGTPAPVLMLRWGTCVFVRGII